MMIFKTVKAYSVCCDREAQTNYELFNLGYISFWHWACSKCFGRCGVYHKRVWKILLPKRIGRRVWRIPLWWRLA